MLISTSLPSRQTLLALQFKGCQKASAPKKKHGSNTHFTEPGPVDFVPEYPFAHVYLGPNGSGPILKWMGGSESVEFGLG